MTHDVAAEASFWEAVLGWRVKGTDYAVLHAEDRVLAGLVPLAPGDDPDAEEGDAPSASSAHWLGQLVVESVEDTARRIAFLQGEVHVPAFDMEGVGTLAIVADPAGAVFSPLQTDSPTPAPRPLADHPPFSLAFCSLVVPRPDLAAKAYKPITGWKPGPLISTDAGPLQILRHKRIPVAAVLGDGALRGGPAAPQWVPHIRVPDVEQALARATAHGAQVSVPTLVAKGLGTLAWLRTPTGALTGLISDA